MAPVKHLDATLTGKDSVSYSVGDLVPPAPGIRVTYVAATSSTSTASFSASIS